MLEMEEYKQDYVVLPLEDYMSLSNIARLRTMGGETVINQSDLMFVAAVVQSLDANECELSIVNGTVHIKARLKNDEIIDAVFELIKCANYYNRVSKFIKEVII